MPNGLNWDNWSEWTKLAELDLRSVPKGPGTYVVAIRQPITRVVGSDPIGMLDVGESATLSKRIGSFINCATNPEAYGHMAGVRFAFLGFSDVFPFGTLWIRWFSVQDKSIAYKVEGRLLRDYVSRHKELPPLNYKYNWSQHS